MNDTRNSKIVGMRRVAPNRVKLILESEWESSVSHTKNIERETIEVEFTSGVNVLVCAKDSSGISVEQGTIDEELDTD